MAGTRAKQVIGRIIIVQQKRFRFAGAGGLAQRAAMILAGNHTALHPADYLRFTQLAPGDANGGRP